MYVLQSNQRIQYRFSRDVLNLSRHLSEFRKLARISCSVIFDCRKWFNTESKRKRDADPRSVSIVVFWYISFAVSLLDTVLSPSMNLIFLYCLASLRFIRLSRWLVAVELHSQRLQLWLEYRAREGRSDAITHCSLTICHVVFFPSARLFRNMNRGPVTEKWQKKIFSLKKLHIDDSLILLNKPKFLQTNTASCWRHVMKNRSATG